MSSPLRIGILGAAQIVPPALIEPAHVMDDVVADAVAARDPARAAAFARTHGIARVVDDYTALVTDPEIDLIYNALPVSEHAPWSCAALKAGKSVLCEKPLAMNETEARRMLDDAASSGARLIEAFHCVYHPAFETLGRWLDDPATGPVTAIEAHFNVGLTDDGNNIRYRPQLGGGAMMDLGCYPVLWALFAARAEPTSIEAEAIMTTTGVDESMRCALGFAGGATARLSCAMQPDVEFSNALRITTRNARIEFDNPLRPQDNGRLVRTMHGETQEAAIDSRTTYWHQLNVVVRSLRDGTTLPTQGNALLVQQRTLDRIYAAAGLRELRYR